MNPDTNELISIKSLKEAAKAYEKGFLPLPKNLELAAKLKLAGKQRAFVSKTSGGKLSKWAAKKRAERSKKKLMVKNCNDYYSTIKT